MGRSRPRSCVRATASTRARCCASWSARARWSAENCGREGAIASGAMWRFCAGSGVPRWPRCARRSSRRASAASPRSCPRGRAWIATPARVRESTGCARCSWRCRGWRCPRRSGSAMCCRDGSARTRRRGWTVCARAERWCGSARGRAGEAEDAWRCTFARTPPRSALHPHAPRPAAGMSRRIIPSTSFCAGGSQGDRASSPICSRSSTSRPRRCARRCGISCGRARRRTTLGRRCGHLI